ncbi:hypothetical protein L228DRAFT_265127 [Xylona heveae TC161]|uniref:Uncharacterized protein n=1 Tax=Xylona heveae (strain CBS 132557 / TC161) TaxID=1328760 RepID=A0A165JXU7_XYLHT|nr:hypothetical protein L228DRAFT_265127 [Xylona heveae TC161]KZF26761.1 hypothetical protein L228DRAFT_265127 [Xylona heveae TC161]
MGRAGASGNGSENELFGDEYDLNGLTKEDFLEIFRMAPPEEQERLRKAAPQLIEQSERKGSSSGPRTVPESIIDLDAASASLSIVPDTVSFAGDAEERIQAFVLRHPFVANPLAPHTKTERRRFTANVYEYARALQLSSERAADSVRYARSVFIKRYNEMAKKTQQLEAPDHWYRQGSPFGLEIDDSADVLQYMEALMRPEPVPATSQVKSTTKKKRRRSSSSSSSSKSDRRAEADAAENEATGFSSPAKEKYRNKRRQKRERKLEMDKLEAGTGPGNKSDEKRSETPVAKGKADDKRNASLSATPSKPEKGENDSPKKRRHRKKRKSSSAQPQGDSTPLKESSNGAESQVEKKNEKNKENIRKQAAQETPQKKQGFRSPMIHRQA